MNKFLRTTLLVLFYTLHAGCILLHAQSVQTGKSYISITRPTGGTIQPGDELEIRAVIAVSGNSVYFARYNDTIPTGTTYIANSIRFTTNEGMNYGTPLQPTGLLTDAGGDDEARYNAGVLRVNLGSLTRSGGGQTAAYNAVAAPNAIDVLPAASGCRIYQTGRPSFYGGTCIIMITYRVTVNAAIGNTFTIPGGAFRYKTANTASEVTLPSIARYLNRMTVMVSDALPVCDAVGANSITGNGGNFGSGTTQNLNPAPAAGTVVPGYQWRAFSAPSNGPNDSMFTVANNTSPTASTNTNLVYPNSNRLFNVWDIIGDHTNAANPFLGNAPTTAGQTGGYMAVVNAAYGINNAVQQTVSGLCPDTYYEFSAWFRNICRRCSCDTSGKGSGTSGFKSYLLPTVPSTNDSAGVLPNLTFQVDGVDYYTTGNLDYNGQWTKKGFLFKTGSSQTSVNIVIRNNAPGGGGNDWVMDDVAFATCLPGLNMRPSNNPMYCQNGQVDMSVVVQSFYNNYQYYRWERSNDNGSSWHNAPLSPTTLSFNYTYNSPYYVDTVEYPSFIANPANNGHRYRIRVATSTSNLSNNSCASYNTTDVITVGVHSTCDVLPATFIFFNTNIVQGNGLLNWKISDEALNTIYSIERSADGRRFFEAGRVSGNNSAFYKWTDSSTAANSSGRIYYRIKMITAAGSKYSSVQLVNRTGKELELKIRSNPFYHQLVAEVTSNNRQKAEVQLIDMEGRVHRKLTQQLFTGVNYIMIDDAYKLQNAVYLLRITVGNTILQEKVIHW
ncbi:T9SS type A sorting domain-containing protein [Lacibacter luteus]|uniref:T9SS type A sorting domain-containing protein n=1 Tax=Lacibacter luteus TaxID=2508719 RepID=A0A4Q1CGR7_9BACT|nr:T9SS type A sorting domain-containing protein [Lacibacter luteus]RXK59312.1 T9SS type A sorting domain-containing protein [Lacibacter luteus]